MRGNDHERGRHRIEVAAFRLSDDAPRIKSPIRPSAGLRTPLQDLLAHKIETVDSARLRAGVGALFSMAGIPIH